MKKTIFFICCCSLYILSCSSIKKNNSENLYKINLKGSASVIRDGKTITLAAGETVIDKDIIKVPEGSELDILIGPDDSIRMKPNTEIMISQTDGKENKKFDIQLNKGKTIVKLNTLKSANTNFKINTPTSVCGVRGTQFSLDSKPSGEDEINVLKGEVSVSAAGSNEEIKIGENEMTTVTPGRPPMAPQMILSSLKPLLSLEVATMRPDLAINAVKTTMAVFDLKTYQRSLEYYYTMNEKYPENISELKMKEVDAWETPLVYYKKGEGYVLFSAGQDRIIGTIDDIQMEK